MTFILQVRIHYIFKTNTGIKKDEDGLNAKAFLQDKKDFKDGAIFHGLFLVPKINHCLTNKKHSVIDEHKTFKRFLMSLII